jgi:hypothetical protein
MARSAAEGSVVPGSGVKQFTQALNGAVGRYGVTLDPLPTALSLIPELNQFWLTFRKCVTIATRIMPGLMEREVK